MQETNGPQSTSSPYAQWLEGYERMTEAWLRMAPQTGQGPAFTDAMRGMMDAATRAGWPPAPGGASAAPEQPSAADAFAAWRDMRDMAVRSWSTVMSNVVNTPGYAEAMGSTLGAYAAMGEPFEKAMEASMSRTLHRMNMPTRDDVTKVLERLTNIEKRLDDLAADR